jgi:hypothetical protein
MAPKAFFRGMPISSVNDSCDMKKIRSRALTCLLNLETMACHGAAENRRIAEAASGVLDRGRVALLFRVIAMMAH